MGAASVRRNSARAVACLWLLVSGACGGSTAITAVPSDDRDTGARVEAGGPGAEASVDDASGTVDEANAAGVDATAANPSDGGASSADSASAGLADVKVAPGAVDAARCGPDSCANGCCDDQGVCEPGTTSRQCGGGGAACQACLPQMLPSGPVIPMCKNQQCAAPAPTCACATGCCDTALGQCSAGTTDTACGQEGEPCVDCTATGLVCTRQRCEFWGPDASVCNGQTCPAGCCDWNGNCQQGLTDTVCGNLGAECVDCGGTGQTCSNQECAPRVGSAACAVGCNGCCDAVGNCQPGNTDTQCGFHQCEDCSAIGATCNDGTCVTPDGGATCFDMCDGCCDATGTCHYGFVDTQCGSGGSPCQDCTHLDPRSTCDLNAGACSNQPACPLAYAGCPSALTQAMPAIEHVCTPGELANLAAACGDGTSSTSDGLPSLTCLVDSVPYQVSAPCQACLENFAFGMPSQTTDGRSDTLNPPSQAGVRACAAPFVDAACNHNSACIVDCLTDACTVAGPCLGATGCESQAQAGTCASYFADDACITQALAGPAAFCDRATYQGNFGTWLQAVGTHYCAQ